VPAGVQVEARAVGEEDAVMDLVGQMRKQPARVPHQPVEDLVLLQPGAPGVERRERVLRLDAEEALAHGYCAGSCQFASRNSWLLRESLASIGDAPTVSSCAAFARSCGRAMGTAGRWGLGSW